ncbi:hypothetical protein GOBAR_DD06454 [Gossypium barbadense]|nr:hypothetical protein GOBAR_DD06454 [Gossypium barbadense]
MTHELELLECFKVYPIFHVSVLPPTHGQKAATPPTFLPINKDWELVSSLAKTLAHQWGKEAGALLDLLLQRVDHTLEKASWENYDLTSQFPSFQLVNKATFQERKY